MALHRHRIKCQGPDDFILHLIKTDPHSVKEAAEVHRQSLKNPPKSIAEFLVSLEMQGVPQSGSALRILFE